MHRQGVGKRFQIRQRTGQRAKDALQIHVGLRHRYAHTCAHTLSSQRNTTCAQRNIHHNATQHAQSPLAAAACKWDSHTRKCEDIKCQDSTKNIKKSKTCVKYPEKDDKNPLFVYGGGGAISQVRALAKCLKTSNKAKQSGAEQSDKETQNDTGPKAKGSGIVPEAQGSDIGP